MKLHDEPDGVLAGKPVKVVPHIPPWKAEGMHSVRMEVEEFVDRLGNAAQVCTAYYKDKKNKDRECTAWVKWR